MTELKITDKGLTDREAKELEQVLKEKGIGWINGKFYKGSNGEEKLLTELECIRMINSIIAYGNFIFEPEYLNKDAEQVLSDHYLQKYTESLGAERVLELIKGQFRAIASVDYEVYTDSEGLSYNSIIWVRD